MDAHERAAVGRRIEQIRKELTYPKATSTQVAALQLELHSLEKSWLAEQPDAPEFIAAAPSETLRLERSRRRRPALHVEALARFESGKAGPVSEDERPRRESRGDVMIGVRTRLKLEEAIERALEESDRPLRADEIAHIVAQNAWIKEPTRNNYVDAIRGALQRHREKLGIVCIEGDRRYKKYWLRRRGEPPQHV
jgi:hypothetical protein